MYATSLPPKILFLGSESARLLSSGMAHNGKMMQKKCSHKLTLKHATGIEAPNWRNLEASAEEQYAKSRTSS